MIRYDTAAATDVGRTRSVNEDAFWKGDSVFAVADGMGGHVAGEVASMTALEPVANLDGRVFPDAEAAVSALAEAVLAANIAVAEKAEADPTYEGMGTTLTAAMLEGRRLHVGHVGDSRAYLLRHGAFSQLTQDHTLVQHLIDSGELTAEEAASHPQRSIITRAIGVSRDIDVDTMTIDLIPGDQVLLCSDGLTGVVEDERIAQVLLKTDDPDDALKELIGEANEAGGPDNITAVLLRVEEEPDETPPPNDGDTGELPENRVLVTSDTGQPSGDWAERIGRFGGFGRARDRAIEDDGEPRPGPTRTQRIFAFGLAIALLATIALVGGRWLLSRSYYVGVDDGQVAIYQGIPGELGPFALSWVSEPTDLATAEVPPWYRDDLVEGIPAADLADARRIVANAPRLDDDQPNGGTADVGTGADDTGTGTGTDDPATPTPTPTASP